MIGAFQQQPVRDNTDGVMKLLQFIEKDAKDSHVMASLGVHTQLAQYISDYLANPLSGMVDTFNSVHHSLVGFIDIFLVKNFFKVNRQKIFKAYIVEKGSPLNYYVVLNDDTTENREVFFEFLDNYEFLNIDRQIPIHFSFLPKEAVSAIPAENEIAIDK